MKIILPVKPISQLFPIPFVMGCEGVIRSDAITI